MSSFSGISAALSAMQAQRKAMDVTGENIANVNTTGYTRQRLDVAAATTAATSRVSTSGTSDPGAGVVVTGTSRLASTFWNAQVNSQTSLHGDLAQRADTLSQLELTTGEPNNASLSTALTTMWSAWTNLANNVGGASTASNAAKVNLVNAAQSLASTISTKYTAVDSQWTDMRAQTSSVVGEVNNTASTVASLNKRIQVAVTSGANANELMDQRDQAVTRLVELTGATAAPAANGMTTVYLGNSALVRGDTALTLNMTGPVSMNGINTAATPPTVLSLSLSDGSATTIAGGQLAASLDGLNVTIPSSAQQYKDIASQVTTTVNTAIASAYTAATAAAAATTPATTLNAPPTFFTYTTAPSTGAPILTVAVTAANVPTTVMGTKGGVSSALYGAADNTIAAAIGKLGTATGGPDSVWSSYVAQLGAQSASATSQATAATATLANAVSGQQSESGVDLDEETANLLVIQRAYQGAARVLTAVDQMLDTLINSTGMAGR